MPDHSAAFIKVSIPDAVHGLEGFELTEHVAAWMGWQWNELSVWSPTGSRSARYPRGYDELLYILPDYANDLGEAWDVWERAPAPPKDSVIVPKGSEYRQAFVRDPDRQYVAGWLMVTDSEKLPGLRWYGNTMAWGTTPELAICRSFLLAHIEAKLYEGDYAENVRRLTEKPIIVEGRGPTTEGEIDGIVGALREKLRGCVGASLEVERGMDDDTRLGDVTHRYAPSRYSRLVITIDHGPDAEGGGR
jgi:hypothetical protein